MLTEFLTEVGGFIRDVEVAKASNNGTPAFNVRPESIPDQASVGVASPTGPNPSGRIDIGGMQVSTNLLIATGVAVAAIGALVVIAK